MNKNIERIAEDEENSSRFLSGHGEEEVKQEEDRVVIGQSENKTVGYMRSVLLLVLCVVAVGVSTAVYLYTQRNEKDDFETQYFDHAQKLVSSFESSAKLRLSAIESFAVSIASQAKARGETWPNVTTPDFERMAAYVMRLSAVMSLTLFQLVMPEDRPGWEAYSSNSTEWIQQSKSYQEHHKSPAFDEQRENASLDYFLSDGGLVIPEGEVRPLVFNLTFPGYVPAPEDTITFPYWQFAPYSFLSILLNYNGLSHPSRQPFLQNILQTREEMVTPAWDYKDNDNPFTAGKKVVLNFYLNRWQQGNTTYEDGPVSDLYYPLFEAYEDENYNEIPKKERKMVAVINSYVYWQVYFENILPNADNAQGVIAILENTCGQEFTYVIHGSRASYVGPGDLHEEKYDEFVVSTGFGAFLGKPGASSEGQCIYNIRVYPSEELEDYFMTNRPILFTVVIVSVFIITSLIFVIYDFVVEKRQTVVMNKAVQSTQVVNTLFPEGVRDRLFDAPATKVQKSFLTSDVDESVRVKDDTVADIHENCTVFFADIAGFTQWCSGREPKDVFALLETLYGRFDSIAKRRGVFKVETIGDCYLAITGAPRPQAKHALIMVRFAVECRAAMSEIIHSELVNTLGEDTAKLQMRIGIHSGPVVAGVVKGDRARYQIFGDTVNTGSRMESNGLPGKVHVSESTANLILDAGKASWLTLREGGVEAKGKGILKTYWVEPTSMETQTESVSSSLTELKRARCMAATDTCTDSASSEESSSSVAGQSEQQSRRHDQQDDISL